MSTQKKIIHSSSARFIVALIIGIVAASIGYINGLGNISVLIGWDVAVFTTILFVWATTWPMNQERTAAFALREDPGRAGVDVILILASLASLGAVGFTLFEAHTVDDIGLQLILTLVGVLSVVLSWILIHTIYMLRYARLYYSKQIEGTVDFKKDHKPAYSDFFYLAFTVGMTFQVADTDLIGTEFRKTVLRHAVLSYVFGTVIVATTVSLIANLGQ